MRVGPTTPVRRCLLTATVLIGVIAACTSAPEPTLTPAEYRAAVQAICTDTAIARAQLTEPVDTAAVGEFARTVAGQLEREADLIRNIRPPDEFDDDHRAFVQNTADQATRWATLATTPATDSATFGDLTDEIAALSFGRDDLAAEMLLPACRRDS